MDEAILAHFEKKPAIKELTRSQLIKAVLTRHETQIKPLRAESRDLRKIIAELEKQRKTARKARDQANELVASNKDQRQHFHQMANEKRREFFVLLEKLDDMEKLDEEMDTYQDRLDKLEWKLQTTAITTKDEKVMIDKMHAIYAQLTETNKEAQKRLGMEKELPTVAGEIGKLLGEAQRHHEDLLTKASDSDIHHKVIKDTGKDLSKLRIRLRQTERKIGIHKECIGYWKDWVGDAK